MSGSAARKITVHPGGGGVMARLAGRILSGWAGVGPPSEEQGLDAVRVNHLLTWRPREDREAPVL